MGIILSEQRSVVDNYAIRINTIRGRQRSVVSLVTTVLSGIYDRTKGLWDALASVSSAYPSGRRAIKQNASQAD